MFGRATELIGARFPLQPRDAGPYADFRVSVMRIKGRYMTAEGLGSAAMMSGSAPFGLMKMETLVIDPFSRDLPLFSFDWISAFGKETMLVEYYDLLLEPAKFDASPLAAAKQTLAGIPDSAPAKQWYSDILMDPSLFKKTGKQDLPALQAGFEAALQAWLELAAGAALLDPAQQKQKRAKAGAYVNGLLRNGGPSTDVFRKALGGERTREFMEKYLFGTAEAV